MLRRPVESALPALIGVMDHVARTTAREGHVERVEYQLRAQVRRHRPADDAAAPGVNHNGDIEKPSPPSGCT
jgi:hypothetical protein